MTAVYAIYRHQDAETEPLALRCGFNFYAGLFRGFWACYHRLWSLGIILFSIDFILNSLAFWLYTQIGFIDAFFYVDLPVTLAFIVLVAGFAHRWRAAFLLTNGWEVATVVHALSPSHALMQASFLQREKG